MFQFLQEGPKSPNYMKPSQFQVQQQVSYSDWLRYTFGSYKYSAQCHITHGFNATSTNTKLILSLGSYRSKQKASRMFINGINPNFFPEPN